MLKPLAIVLFKNASRRRLWQIDKCICWMYNLLKSPITIIIIIITITIIIISIIILIIILFFLPLLLLFLFSKITSQANTDLFYDIYSQLTYADIIFFDLMNLLEKVEPTVMKALEKFPLLAAHYKRVLDVPEIKKWIETRPVTER